jgi:hypothetical protein
MWPSTNLCITLTVNAPQPSNTLYFVSHSKPSTQNHLATPSSWTVHVPVSCLSTKHINGRRDHSSVERIRYHINMRQTHQHASNTSKHVNGVLYVEHFFFFLFFSFFFDTLSGHQMVMDSLLADLNKTHLSTRVRQTSRSRGYHVQTSIVNPTQNCLHLQTQTLLFS